nr:AMP-binding protein [Psychrobacter sp. PraFG1]UTT87747.1 AMP-binding protein [Psychrobacter sp. PraFG1]
MNDFFDDTLTKFAKNKFMTNMSVSYTYAEVDQMSKNIAAWIQTLGLAQGSTVGIMMPNVNQYLPIVIGALRAGMVLTLINPLYTSRELKHQLIDADAKIIFILEPFAHGLDSIIDKTPVETVVVSAIGDMLGTAKGALINLAAKHLKKQCLTMIYQAAQSAKKLALKRC